MTELLTGVEAPSDAELISRVRGRDLSAYGELFSRHVEAARRLGRQLVRGPDVDDLVSDAFAKTLNVLQNGGGPDVAFRAYLLTSLRRLHVDKIRAAKKVQPEEDMTVFDDGVPFQDTAVANFDNGAAAKAFASLPERWQLVLWHLEVEGQKPADIAPLLGMTPNSVSALAYRAREGLRQAFLTMHLADTPTEQCRWVNEHLGAYVRKGLSKRDTTKVEDHLEDCRRCTAMYLELNEVNSNLAGIIAPLLLGAAAAGYVSSAGGAGATGVSALFGRVRDAVSGNGAAGGAGAGGSTAATAGGAAATTGGLVTAGGVVAASVAAITAAAFIFGGGAEKEVITEADQPFGIVQTPTPGAGEDREPLEKSAAEDEESAEAAERAETDDQAGQDVPLAAADDGGFDLDGTADSPDGFPAAPAFDAGVVAPPAVVPADPAPGTGAAAGDNPTAPRDDTPPAPGEDPAPGEPGNPSTDPGTDTPPNSETPNGEQPATPGPGPAEPAPTPADPQDPVDETPPGHAPSTPPADEEPVDGTPPDSTGEESAAIQVTANVSEHSLTGTTLSFSIDFTPASPSPATVVVRLTGSAGVAFDSEGGYCRVSAADTTVAECDVLDVPSFLAAGTFAMPGLSESSTSPRVSAALDFSGATAGQAFGLEVSAPAGYEFLGDSVLSIPDLTVPSDDDGGTDPTDPGDGGDDGGAAPTPSVTAELDRTGAGQPNRTLTVTVSNSPSGDVLFTLVKMSDGTPSAISFTAAPECTVTDAQLTCGVPTSGAQTWDVGVTVPQGHLDQTLLRATFSDPDVDPIDVPLFLED